ncbi:DUF3078 domain-containing protein [Spirosoma sp. KCTC 42546]|uniref:DUF3078 domain-containing protein n=1 Tax=Spirosoma sp. KCTC 42546 TaxID=2520506 RepID=UPI001159EA1B|nr:DUF3078 domain-containing protein [Spirosoma sp. KCTC 42546]QDK82941.1 DUF3078 domain-containing protein [Spirosoma sp. KCTC 42546]
MSWSFLSQALAQDSPKVVPSDSVRVTKNFKDTISVKPDTSYWQRSFSGGVNFNQASFSNWSGGGVNSLAIGGVIAARALYEKGKTSWDNTADLQLGYLTQLGNTRKAADQIILISVIGHQIAPKWDLFVSGTFNTFFAPGYRYDKLPADQTRLRVSNFFAPAQLTLSMGIAYKPNDWFSLRMSPIAPRFTFLADQSVRVREQADGTFVPDATQKAFGVDPGKSSRMEWLAFQLQAALNRNLTENISINARYQLFTQYAQLDNINHRLDLIMTAKASRYLSTTFGLILLYNKDFSSSLQIQQTLAIGLSYNISSFKKKKDPIKATDPLPGRF